MGGTQAVRVHNIDGDLVHIELDEHWIENESENVAVVHVRRFGNKSGSTQLGRIDRREMVYHLRHHGLQDFVRWSDKTVTLGIEELILARQEGVIEISYLDERNSTRYSVSIDMVFPHGYAVKREQIGWRWALPLEFWTKRKVT
jgi:hypothetical protein